jgi:branched-chain amino acid transport system permease protein
VRFFTNETILAVIALNIIFAQSFYITYMTGQLSFGHAAFATIGGYAAGILTTRYGFPMLGAFALAAMVSFLCGIIVAVPALRTRHIYLAILTFGIMQIATYTFENWSFVGGVHGIAGMSGVDLPYILVATAAVVGGTWWLERSRLGLAMRSVKRDEPVAALMGINTVWLRLLSFGIGSAVAGIGGALYAHYNFFIDPQTFGLAIAISMVFYSIVGGTQFWLGPVVGSILLTLVPELSRDFLPKVDSWRPAIYGAIIVGMLVVRPEGLIRRKAMLDLAARVRRQLLPNANRADDPKPASLAQPTAARPADGDDAGIVLSFTNVSKAFGGVQALADVSIQVPQRSIWGIIGPNGAGKTTLFNILTGVYAPNSGQVAVSGVDTTRKSPSAIARLGVSRTFQNIRLFGEMTVLENVLVGQHRNSGTGLFPGGGRARAKERHLRDRAEHLIRQLHLWDVRGRFAVELPYAMQRRVEIARALALEPQLLLLDEPTAGMDPNESAEIVQVIRQVHDAFGLTILLIEHDMSVVMNVCQRITVLNFGRKIAEGAPAEIQADALVREAYLGAEP